MTEVLTVGALGSTLLRRWKIIVLAAVLGAVAGTAYGVLSPKTYTAKAVLIVMAGAGEQSGFYQAAQFAEKRAATYPTLLTAPEVVDQTRESLELPYSSTTLLGLVTATNPTDTPVVEVAATSQSPDEAREIADSIADNIIIYALDLEESGARNTSVTIQKAVPAREPTSPTSPSSAILGALGLLAGAAVGVLTALILRTLPGRRRQPVPSALRDSGDAPAATPQRTTVASTRWRLAPRREAADDTPSPSDDVDPLDPLDVLDGKEEPAKPAARTGIRRGPRVARASTTTVGRPAVGGTDTSSPAREGARSATSSR